MKMYICEDCGEVFEEPKTFYESHGLDSPPYEQWSVCPNCSSTNYKEAHECSRCGEYAANLEDGLCDICYEDMYGE